VALEDLGKIFGEENDRETNSVRDDDAWDRMGTTLQDAKMPRWAWGDGEIMNKRKLRASCYLVAHPT